jgi:hypothetical protein
VIAMLTPAVWTTAMPTLRRVNFSGTGEWGDDVLMSWVYLPMAPCRRDEVDAVLISNAVDVFTNNAAVPFDTCVGIGHGVRSVLVYAMV